METITYIIDDVTVRNLDEITLELAEIIDQIKALEQSINDIGNFLMYGIALIASILIFTIFKGSFMKNA